MFMPDHPVIQNACTKARLAFDQGQTDDALRILDTADLQIDGDKPILTLHRAEFQLAAGHQESVLNNMAAALDMAPHSGNVQRYITALLERCEITEQTESLRTNVITLATLSPYLWQASENMSRVPDHPVQMICTA